MISIEDQIKSYVDAYEATTIGTKEAQDGRHRKNTEHPSGRRRQRRLALALVVAATTSLCAILVSQLANHGSSDEQVSTLAAPSESGSSLTETTETASATSNEDGPNNSSDDLQIDVRPTSPETRLARLEVELDYDAEHDCIYGRVTRTSRSVIIIWPDGYTAKGTPPSLYDANQREVSRVGERLELVGGYVPKPQDVRCNVSDSVFAVGV